MTEAIWYSALSGFSTFLGTMVVVWWGTLSSRMIALSLGLSSSVMLMVAYGDLLPTAVQASRGSFFHVALGMSLALLLMYILHQGFSRLQNRMGVEVEQDLGRLGLVLSAAVIAHNAPEGAAIGIGFGAAEELGITLAAAMAVHNIPEGIGMAAPLMAAGRSRWFVAALSLLSGSALPFGTWVGMRYLLFSPDVVAVGLVFAMTAMMWVVAMEVGPRAWKMDCRFAWIGALLGILMMYLLHELHSGHG
jgi:zinc transporter, ZIP family